VTYSLVWESGKGASVADHAELAVNVLGPLEVRVGDMPVAPPPGKQAVVLACLAMSGGQPLSVETLARKVWGDQRPENVRQSLHTLVARLRQAVASCDISWQPSGYCLDIRAENVDLLWFRNLVAEADLAHESGEVRGLLKKALDLWRGEPLAGLRSDVFERDDCLQLAEERLAVLKRRLALDLEAAQHEQLVPELRVLTERFPLDEWLWSLRMLALHRSGRSAEALGCYAAARKRFIGELGIEPGLVLADLQRAILLGDPRLGVSPDSGTPVGTGGQHFHFRQSNQVPCDLSDFTGRKQELARITAAARSGTGRVMTVTGMAGTGKTALAVRASHRLAPLYPDAQVFVELNGSASSGDPVSPFDALGILLRAVGAAHVQLPASLAERASLWRACLADRRAVVILDDAADSAQVRPLFPGATRSLVLITSRRRLIDLESVHDRLRLEGFDSRQSQDFILRMTGAERVAPQSARELSRLCADLPLALRIVGQRLLAGTVRDDSGLVLRLRNEQRRLRELTIGDRSVAGALDESYRRLTPELRRLFGTLGLVSAGSPFTAADVAALADTDVDKAEEGLEGLADANLLNQSGPGLYQLHELVRIYARDRAFAENPAIRQLRRTPDRRGGGHGVREDLPA
jgi:DNA-binding SARP family transcriptional activator